MWGMECERASIGLVSASPHGCFTPDLIRTLSLICLCLGQTSLCVFCSGSSLPGWPQTMSGRTGGFLSSLSMAAVGNHRSPKKAQYMEGEGLCWLSRTTAWLWPAVLLRVVFFTHQCLLKLIDFVRIWVKRSEFLSAVVKPKANMSLKISLQWLDQDLMNWGFQTFKCVQLL